MRILWFTNTSSCFQTGHKGYNGGGWISSLEIELKKHNIELGVCFYMGGIGEAKKETQNGTTYYILPRPSKTLFYTLTTISGKVERSSQMHERMAIPNLLDVVNDFHPNIIQVFGSENIYGLIAKYVKTPVILHIQGILSPYLNAFLPPFISWRDYINQTKSIKGRLRLLSDKIAWQRNSYTEKRIFGAVKYFMGRTEWDKRIVSLLNPTAKYYYCSEILRDTFYALDAQRILPERPVFVTTISSQLYKGFDLVLKTAKLLKDTWNYEFEWKVFGDINPIVAEKICNTIPKSVNVHLLGVASDEKIRESLLHATAYVHTSYIDNSPNSLCEAMILGVSTISTNVGGIPSLVENGKTGFLVPSNDPYQMVYLMKLLFENRDMNISIGKAAQEVAEIRHDRETIVNRVLEIYDDVLKYEKH